MANVTVTLVDENTLEFDGSLFIRKSEEEVLLRPIYNTSIGASSLTPLLQCSNCGYKLQYFSVYRLTGFQQRFIKHCPGCGFKIMGVAGKGGAE